MDEGRFPPGTLLAQRYRIVTLLGRGGMGEVYRANDLLLGQAVALKFLPPKLNASEELLNRFRGEVRTARMVSHPNVCRVFDIGEADGVTYLSMEYVDGEDLASLLRRIGKLPQDKALEIARKLCAGLAAAHDKDVIHRDLKPANIMLDGQGNVRITDFGLAGIADQVRDPRSGTPAYMAPEQRSGHEVTARSDIYSLGLVLHELFTGKRPSADASKPELDPAVERVLLRCLDQDPQKRPATALAVSAALPGGDPLAAALAAGETPTPEMVANAGVVEGMQVRPAVLCLAAIVVGLIVLCFVRQRADIVNHLPLENSPTVLAARARDIAKTLGYADRPVDYAYGWEYDWPSIRKVRDSRNDDSARWAALESMRPPALAFWYRESPVNLIGLGATGITRSNPAPLGIGSLEMLLDPEGRLVEFQAQPLLDSKSASATPEADWTRLFAAAGLDPRQFAPAQLEGGLPVPAGSRAAWTGSPSPGAEPLRAEAAEYQGRPVFFKLGAPWSYGAQFFVWQISTLSFLALFIFALPLLACFFAWRNIRLSRGDRSGALRLAAFSLVTGLASALLLSSHAATSLELFVVLRACRESLLAPAIFWVQYIAFEPYVRRQAPEMLISWNRFLAGRFQDPVLGRDLLLGVLLGVSAGVAAAVEKLAGPLSESRAPGLFATQLPVSAVQSAGMLLFLVLSALGGGLSMMLIWLLLRLLSRRRWLIAAAFIVLLSLVFGPGPGPGWAARLAANVMMSAIFAFAFLRFGLVASWMSFVTCQFLGRFPMTTDLSAWYASTAVLIMLGILGLALYGFRTTLAGRPLWPDENRD